jgi:hypothetical protein
VADTKISAYPSLSGANAADNDVLVIADVSASATKSITLTEIVNYLKEKLSSTDLSDVVVASAATGEVLEYTGSTFQNVPIAGSVVVVDPTGFANSSATNAQTMLSNLDSAITVGGISSNIVDAAGDLIVATADNTVARKAKGSNYTSLTVDGTGSVNWGDPRSYPFNVNTQTGTTYTGVLTDAGKVVTLSNASTITMTVPPNSSVAYPTNTVIDLVQLGAGQVTVAAGGGVTINTSSTLKLRTQYSSASLIKTDTDTWVLVGDLEPLGQALNAQTGTTYSLVIGDAWKLVTLSNASGITLTIPANASVAFPVGTHIDLMQLGAGQVTVAITSDTLRSTPTAKMRTQYSMATLVKIASTTWALSGDLATS